MATITRDLAVVRATADRVGLSRPADFSGGVAGEGPWWALIRDPFRQYLAARRIVDHAPTAGDVVTRVKRAVFDSGFVEGPVYVAELVDELEVSLQRELDEQSD
ncbi:hypothetical protein [Streptomyces sp. NPDC015414]|uniref:hypothetical protein n=1 Tax=Streptomyces sp. NPDC015414 TaxID=3364957 RepID=UPI0036FAD734